MAARHETILGAMVLVGASIGAGCEGPAPPWKGRPTSRAIDPTKPFLAKSGRRRGWLPASSASTPANSAQPLGSGATRSDPRSSPSSPPPKPWERPSLQSKSRAGGLWARCYDGFQPVGEPADAVTRLALLCGPATGMRQHGPMHRGKLGPSPSEHTFELKQGECVRIFTVASEGVANLDIEVWSSRGTLLHRDSSHNRWPIVEPRRPFCSFADDRFKVKVQSPRGRGHYALQVWVLPAASQR